MTPDEARVPVAGKRVTILDVAEAAGVQPSTVSKALNEGRGSAEVRGRILEAATALGYRPNQRARGLRRSESRSIGVLIPDLANPVFLPLLRGVEQAAQERGYVVLIADGQRSDAAETAILERFFDQGVDGLLLAGPVTRGGLRLYVEHGVPIAPSLSDYDRNLARHWEQAEAAATRAMGERLLELGHQRFVFVGASGIKGQHGRRYRRGRWGAFSAVLDVVGVDLSLVPIDPARADQTTRDELVRALSEHAPTAVVCASHLLAPHVLMALTEVGVDVPRDASVVVYGDSDWARAHVPSLSVVAYDTFAEGYGRAVALLDAIAGAEEQRRAPIDSQYIERGSCGPPPPALRS